MAVWASTTHPGRCPAGPDALRSARPLTGRTVEYVGERLLADLRDGSDLVLSAGDLDVEQVRTRREVPVPEPVVNRLEVPDSRARFDIDRDKALGEQVATGRMPPYQSLDGVPVGRYTRPSSSSTAMYDHTLACPL